MELAPRRLLEPELERVVARLELASLELEPWRADAERHSVVPIEGENGSQRYLLQLPSAGARRIGIPVELDPRSFNQLRLEYTSDGGELVYIHLARGGKPVVGSDKRWLSAAPGLRSLVLDVPATRLEQQPIDELIVHFENVQPGTGRISALAAVELVHLPDSLRLPAAPQRSLIAIGGQSRSGFGLDSGSPLVGRCQVPPGAELRFGYGQPKDLRLPGVRATLEVGLCAAGSAGQAESQRFELEPDFEQAAGWRTARLSLEDYAGSEIELSFALEVQGAARALCAISEVALARRGANPPSVLLVTSDTHRADYLGAAPKAVEVETPNLDALAARGVLYSDCFSSTNVTNPSHVALMTAVHPRDSGVWNNLTALTDDAETLAEIFESAGFRTFAAVSAMHLGDSISGLGQGFQRLSSPLRSDRTATETIDALHSWLADADGFPLFVWLHLYDAHTPYAPPGEFDRKYYPKDKDPYDPELPLSIDERLIPSYMYGLRDTRFPEAQYRGEISYLDRQLGRLLDSSRFERGIVAVTGDHGESFGRHGIWWDHADLYPDTIHVPLILAYPGGPRGSRIERPVSHVNLGRTLLDLAGLATRDFPGQTLTPVRETELAPPPRFSFSSAGHSAAVTVDDWHLILHLDSHSVDSAGVFEPRERHKIELYHLARDAACEEDLAATEVERARHLRAGLIKWLGARRDLGWSHRDLDDAERIRELGTMGYTDGGGAAQGVAFIDEDCDCEQCSQF